MVKVLVFADNPKVFRYWVEHLGLEIERVNYAQSHIQAGGKLFIFIPANDPHRSQGYDREAEYIILDHDVSPQYLVYLHEFIRHNFKNPYSQK